MKKNQHNSQLNKVTSLLLTATLVLTTLGVVNINAYATEYTSTERYRTGLDSPIFVTNEITQEEYEDKVDEESLVSIANAIKLTDDYWTQFSVPYYEYRDSMSDKQIELYDKLYDSLYEMIDGGADLTEKYGSQYLTPAVTFDGISNTDAMCIGYLMLYVHPELYYLNTVIKVGNVEDSTDKFIQLGVYGDFKSGDVRSEYAAAIQEKIDWYLEQIVINESTTPLEIEQEIHDLICDNVSYDSKASYNQSCASTFLIDRTVCAGYSESFAMLCRASGIPVISVTSDEHEWNEVLLGDYWYVVDVTWDDQGYNISYDYFNKSYATVYGYSEHSTSMHTVEPKPWDYVGYPECLYDYGNEPGDEPEPEPEPEPQPIFASVNVYRLYNPNTGEHFYTTNYSEVLSLDDMGWTYEGVAWNAPDLASTEYAETEAVYRLCDPNTGDHLYTMNYDEMQLLVVIGWIYEGINWYSDPGQGAALYRLYNPNADIGAHHYTTNYEECFALIEAGWEYEGVAWYGM